MRRRFLLALTSLALLAPAGCGAGYQTPRLSRPQMLKRLRGSPVALQRLHADAARLIPSTPGAFHALLRRLRRHPIVINVWASWCDNCRAEGAAFQTASVTFGKRVAFLGVDAEDNTGSAVGFLREFLPAYPSYADPHQAIARSLQASGLYPQTLFYNTRGREIIDHGGSYATTTALEHDVMRYALH